MTATDRRGTKDARTASESAEHTMRAVPLAVPAMRRFARSFAADHGAGYRLQLQVSVAVSEAVANAVRHAYQPECPGPVLVTTAVRDGMLFVTVRDRGAGFEADSQPGLGLGLKLMAETSADMEIARTDDGTEIRMRFVLPAA